MPGLRMTPRGILFAGLVVAAMASLTPATPSWSAPVASGRTSFDGNWSVLIVTDAGSCDRAYRYALRIANGRIYYPDPSIAISGHVDGRGHVNVSLSAGGQSASGAGRLSGDSGEGSWRGRSSTSACSGHWEAERRG